MRMRRIAMTGLAEIADRGRQETLKWLDRIGVAGIGSFEAMPDDPGRSVLDPRSAAVARRFFPGATDPWTPETLARHAPKQRERVLAEADGICAGRFNLLGHEGLSFGQPIDWHLDPLARARAPLVHWSRFDTLRPLPGGDAKLVWELNRHQWLVRLGQAWRLSGDERYAAAALRLLREWMRQNPPGIGINWTSSLEVSLRLIAWCWTLFLLGDSDLLGPAELARILHGIAVHAWRVERHLSHYFSPNTHLTGEALGLFYAGAIFAELPSADRWRAAGERILLEQIERQVLEDGVYFEQSTGYQRYTVETYLHYAILARRAGGAVPDVVRGRVDRMLDFLLAVRGPGGTMPEIGDADGGAILPLCRRASEDAEGLLSVAAAVLQRADCAAASGGVQPETVWMLGSGSSRAFDALLPRGSAPPPSKTFRAGGYVVMSSGPDRRAHHLIFDVGPLGCPPHSAHGHADLLGIQVSVFGEPCIVDPGTFAYASDPSWRDYFRGTFAHSTLVVDGADQAVPDGPFGWSRVPQARLSRFQNDVEHDFADAHHEAYSDRNGPVVHRRRILFVKPRYWVVVDDVWGRGMRCLDFGYQFAARARVESLSATWHRVKLPTGRCLLLGLFACPAPETVVFQGSLDPIRGWIAPAYGRRAPAPQLRAVVRRRLPARLVALLVPGRVARARAPAVSALSGPDERVGGLALPDWREVVRIDERDVTLEKV